MGNKSAIEKDFEGLPVKFSDLKHLGNFRNGFGSL